MRDGGRRRNRANKSVNWLSQSLRLSFPSVKLFLLSTMQLVKVNSPAMPFAATQWICPVKASSQRCAQQRGEMEFLRKWFLLMTILMKCSVVRQRDWKLCWRNVGCGMKAQCKICPVDGTPCCAIRIMTNKSYQIASRKDRRANCCRRSSSDKLPRNSVRAQLHRTFLESHHAIRQKTVRLHLGKFYW